jgi:hypothetical protein
MSNRQRSQRGQKPHEVPKIKFEISLDPEITSNREYRTSKIEQDVKPLLMPKVKRKRRNEKAPSPFPRSEPIRDVFCCSKVIETTHKGNDDNDYSTQITQFLHFTKQKHNKEAIPVVDMTWQGLATAEFILQLKQGMLVEERDMVTRSKNKGGDVDGESENESEEGVIEWRLGRYFASSAPGIGEFVELLFNDGYVPSNFENVLGVCRELSCEKRLHQGVLYQIEVWECAASLEIYLKK